ISPHVKFAPAFQLLNIGNMNHQPLDFFLLRRPLLPTDLLYDLNKEIGLNPGSFDERILSLFSQPLLAEAVSLASPGLYNAFLRLKENREAKGGKKILNALYKYLIRMCTRATPYGLFAGIATGEF